jgi:hypothetical protein
MLAAAFLAAAAGLAQNASPFTGGAWCGNVTATTATVKVRLAAAGLGVRLAFSTNSRLEGANYTASVVSNAVVGNVATSTSPHSNRRPPTTTGWRSAACCAPRPCPAAASARFPGEPARSSWL